MYQTPIAKSPPTIVPKARVNNPFMLAPVVGLIPRTRVIVIHIPRYSVKKLYELARNAGIVPAKVAHAARTPN